MLSIDISHNGKYFASGGSNGYLRIWEYESGKLISEMHGHSRGVGSVAFADDDKQIVSVGYDGIVMIWNLFMG